MANPYKFSQVLHQSHQSPIGHRQLTLSSNKLEMKLAVLAVFSIVGIVAGLAAETGLSADILKAIKGKEDLNRVSDYLERFSEGFNKDFPAVGAGKFFSHVHDIMNQYWIISCVIDGKKAAYTFFFPTSFSFMRQLPQDVADPFFLDEEFRRSVFLRHVVRQSIAPKDLEKLNKLVMADSKEAVITREAGNIPLIDLIL